MAYDAVAESALVGAGFFIQALDEMYLVINTSFDLAKIFALPRQAREALLASLGFFDCFLRNGITRLFIH
jgi:hypothetical protein